MPRTVRPVAAVTALVAMSLLLTACPTTNPYARGPAPTASSIKASVGPYATATLAVPTSAGFGGGTIYYPTGTTEKFGAVVVFPGFIENAGNMGDWGTRLASNGFVTLLANSTNGFIQPPQRSTEQLQALDYVVAQGGVSSSPIFNKVDGTRTAVIGHSMGGGGTLISATNRPSLKAAIPLAPWNTSSSFGTVRVPTLIFACQSDSIAPVASHASPMYNSIPTTTKKSYISAINGNHFCANTTNPSGGMIGGHAVAWLKKFVDNDTRYDPWVCGASKATAGAVWNEVRSTCPF